MTNREGLKCEHCGQPLLVWSSERRGAVYDEYYSPDRPTLKKLGKKYRVSASFIGRIIQQERSKRSAKDGK